MNEYSPKEEQLNIITHAFGFALSILALVLLVKNACHYGDLLHIGSALVYGGSLVVLYAASTLYHSAKKQKLREHLNIFDHSAIYVLIAGTYTPFTLITLNSRIGWIIFSVSWGMAFIGIILKLFFIGKYKILSTLIYVLMGWMIVFAIKPLINNLPSEGLLWLFAGGVSYTIGAILYSVKKIRFNHAIFHVFVLIGSFCHFYSVFYYVIPSK